jgi:ABC-2 type transport system ATP-binding protein
MLEARNLVKRFFGVTVVNDICISVRPGEIVGYLGANGSGKTTTARMLTGLLEPTRGSTLFNGRDISEDLVEYRRHIGYVPEEPYLYPFLSGREYLQLVARLRELPVTLAEQKIGSLLTLLGLSSAGDQDISSYSKGMKQKILIIAALLHDPEVLIFDEPDSGLDATSASVLQQLIRTLASRGKAVLYSSHILEIVERLCTRVVVLHHGRIVADDSVARLEEVSGRASLDEVFGDLISRADPQQTAIEIADVVALRP